MVYKNCTFIQFASGCLSGCGAIGYCRDEPGFDRVLEIYPEDILREAAKKSSFLSGPATKTFTPPGLVTIGTFFLTLK